MKLHRTSPHLGSENWRTTYLPHHLADDVSSAGGTLSPFTLLPLLMGLSVTQRQSHHATLHHICFLFSPNINNHQLDHLHLITIPPPARVPNFPTNRSILNPFPLSTPKTHANPTNTNLLPFFLKRPSSGLLEPRSTNMTTATQPLLSSPFASDARARERDVVPWRVRYLQVYNLVSCMAWVTVLGRVLLLLALVGFEHVHGGVGTWLRWTQTMAGLEVLHSLSGMFSSHLISFPCPHLHGFHLVSLLLAIPPLFFTWCFGSLLTTHPLLAHSSSSRLGALVEASLYGMD